MNSFLLYFSFLLINFATANPAFYTSIEHILLNCGSSSKLHSSDGQSWDSDVDTKLSPDIYTANLSFPATAAEQDPSLISTTPYMTARIILSRFSYTFPVSPGQKILRLYFYPATYSGGLYANQSFFAVTANHYTLLRNFSAFLAVSQQKPQSASLVKEFIIKVEQNQLLNVTFSPSANSYAFVNGIEVVSILGNLYMGRHQINHNPLRLTNSMNSFYVLDQEKTSFETVYRLNVGGGAVSAVDDTGMFREWLQDDNFISGEKGNPLSNATISLNYNSRTQNYSAPPIIYTTARAMGSMSLKFNLTWIFPVDSGFFYLLRLHFCEFMPYLINSTSQRMFTIFINNMTAQTEADIIYWTGGTGIPIFMDYVVLVPNPSGGQRKQELFLALRPNLEVGSMYADAILNGLEIFKLSSHDGNLAGSNPEIGKDSGRLSVNSKPRQEMKGTGRIGIVFAVFEGVAGVGAILLILSLLISRRRRGKKDFDRKSVSRSSHRFSSIPSS